MDEQTEKEAQAALVQDSMEPVEAGADELDGTGAGDKAKGKSAAKSGGKKKKSSSLRLQIGLLYTLLALINIMFFSVMILENQTSLLSTNIKLQYKAIITKVRNDLGKDTIPRQRDDAYNALKTKLLTQYDMREYTIFDGKGEIWHQEPPLKEGESRKVDPSLFRKSNELKLELNIFRTLWKLDTNPATFEADFLVPLTGQDKQKVYLHTVFSLKEIQDQLTSLYWQVLGAVVWGVIFHIIFAIFVYRVIFRRVGDLTDASNQMAQGDLKTRVDWKIKRPDELDELGVAFNGMADQIEKTVETVRHQNEEIQKNNEKITAQNESITRLNVEIQNELEIGKDVQQLFLPWKGILKEFDVAVYYRPLREVSGDIYNFFDIKDRYKALFFADASGHGVSAALVTAITLMYLDDSIKHSIQPARVIGTLNNSLADRLQSSFFATAAFLVFDQDGTCYFTNAGHNPPFYFRPSTGKIGFLEKCGPPLGMFEDVEYKTLKMQTRPGDKIIVYSDALVETKNHEGEMFGLERAQALVEANMHKPNAEIVEILKTELDDFAAEYTDDVSIICVEAPERAVETVEVEAQSGAGEKAAEPAFGRGAM